jgi:hypothetical protein
MNTNKRDYIQQLWDELMNSGDYNANEEPSDAETINDDEIDSRGSSDLWYISDDGFVVNTPSLSPIPQPPRKRRRLMINSKKYEEKYRTKKKKKHRRKKKHKKKHKKNHKDKKRTHSQSK